MNTLIKFQKHKKYHKYSKTNKKVQITRVPLESQPNYTENKRTGTKWPKSISRRKRTASPLEIATKAPFSKLRQSVVCHMATSWLTCLDKNVLN